MARTSKVSLSREIRGLLNRELASHEQVHAGHTLLAQAEPQKAKPQIPNRYKVIENIPAYTVRLGRAARSGLANAERAGTVLLVTWSSGSSALVEINEKKGQAALTRVSSGPIVSKVERALDLLRSNSRKNVKRSHYLRFVSVAGIHMTSVWRHHPKNSAKDIVIPILQNFVGLRVGKTYARSRVDALVASESTKSIISWYERSNKPASTYSGS